MARAEWGSVVWGSGRAAAARFSDAEFARTWGDAIGPLLRRAAAEKAAALA